MVQSPLFKKIGISLIIILPVLFIDLLIFVFTRPYVNEIISLTLVIMIIPWLIVSWLFSSINAPVLAEIEKNQDKLLILMVSFLCLALPCVLYAITIYHICGNQCGDVNADDRNDNNFISLGVMVVMSISYYIIAIIRVREKKENPLLKYVYTRNTPGTKNL